MYNIVTTDSAQSFGIEIPYISVDYALAVNEVGRFNATCPGDLPYSMFDRDMMVAVFRRSRNGSWVSIGKTPFFLQKASYTVDDAGDFWKLEFESALGLLARRLVAYKQETTYADKTYLNANVDTADNLMRTFISENFGASATDTARDISAYLGNASVPSEGPVVEMMASFKEVLTTIRELAELSFAEGVPLYYDVNFGAGKLEFRTSIGQLGINRTLAVDDPNWSPGIFYDVDSSSNAVVFSDRDGQLASPTTMEMDWGDEASYCYVGGLGTGAGRALAEVDSDRSTSTPFSRIETFLDARDYDDANYLAKLGGAELAKRRPKLRVDTRVLETPTRLYGVHYELGDLVTVFIKGRVVNCHVAAISGRYEYGDDQDDLEIFLRGEVDL